MKPTTPHGYLPVMKTDGGDWEDQTTDLCKKICQDHGLWYDNEDQVQEAEKAVDAIYNQGTMSVTDALFNKKYTTNEQKTTAATAEFLKCLPDILTKVGAVVGDQILETGYCTSKEAFTFADCFLLTWLMRHCFNPDH